MAVDKYERLTSLLATLLQAAQPMTQEELVREVPGYEEASTAEARRAAFERDKRLLRETGVPLEVTRVDRGDVQVEAYRVDPDQYELPDLGLTEAEQVALGFAIGAVRLDLPTTVDPALSLGLVDVETPPLAALPTSPVLADLHAASAAGRQAAFKYKGDARHLQVWGLGSVGGFWYAVGHDPDADGVRTFRVDRIDGKVTTTETTFERPAGVDIRSHLPSDPTRVGDGDEVTVTVAIDAAHAARVVAEVGSDRVIGRRDDGSVEISLTINNLVAFRSWLLGLLDHAVVVDPPEVRDHVVGWLAAIAGEVAR